MQFIIFIAFTLLVGIVAYLATRKTDENTEDGYFLDRSIFVYHGTDKTLLTSWKEGKDENHWNLIWNLINSLKGLSE